VIGAIARWRRRLTLSGMLHPGAAASATIRVHAALAEIGRAAWDACANPPLDDATASDPYNPFLAYDFLQALEESGAVSARTGWLPQHLALEGADGAVEAVVPCYLKSHSQGEYVFDHGWADAFERAGGRYYPKLQVSVPFTPVTGRRLLTRGGDEATTALLAGGLAELCRQRGASSAHLTFLTEAEWRALARLGFLQRTDRQFHFVDEGYGDFEGFLASLASRKRKALRRERREALEPGIEIVWKRGGDIGEADWDAFFRFYMDTGSRKWGRPYLNRRFFSLLGERMAERCLLIFAMRGKKPIAGALNLIGSDTLYGRYWGAVEHHPFLHFEVCYYQAIDYALAHGLSRVEAGAQGEHKLARGYLPHTTYSAHYIENPSFRRAIESYLAREREHVAWEAEALKRHAPFRRGGEECTASGGITEDE